MTATRQSYLHQTQREVQRALNSGVKQLTPAQIRAQLSQWGYSIEFDFDYSNTHNAIAYAARSMSIIDIATGKRFSNTEVNNPNLPQLQEFRRNHFAVEDGRIWEF